jgi:hypothetical protein
VTEFLAIVVATVLLLAVAWKFIGHDEIPLD